MAADGIAAQVGRLIRSAREAAGLNQGELAGRLGVTQTAVSYWEAGKRTLAVDDLLKVARALGVPPVRLLPAGGEHAAGCPECPDGHRDPNRRPWSVHVVQRGDGQPPMTLHVAPSAGGHVAESDAAWLRELIRRGRVELGVPPDGGTGEHGQKVTVTVHPAPEPAPRVIPVPVDGPMREHRGLLGMLEAVAVPVAPVLPERL